MRTGRASRAATGPSPESRKEFSGSMRNVKAGLKPVVTVASTPPANPSVTTPSSSAQKLASMFGRPSPAALAQIPSKPPMKAGVKDSMDNPPSPVKPSPLTVGTPTMSTNGTTTTAECSSPSSSEGGTSNVVTCTGKQAFAEAGQQQRPSEPVPPDDKIKVAVRVRPLLPHEQESDERKGWEWEHNSIHLIEHELNIFGTTSKTVKQSYQFDHLFTPEATNEGIFNTVVKNIVRSAMEGFHGSVFTYGQTSSGKTFTMNGDKSQPGIIPQAIAECFDSVNTWPGRDFILRVSYLEVYNEQIKDLLSTEPVPVRIQHDPKRGTVLTGVKEQVVLNTQQVLALIKSGEAHRHVGSTDMNEKSSRAHTLFKLIIESTSTCGKEPVRVSTLYLVDLAGSESAKMTNSKGERAREAKHINQSLLTLSTIIQRLSEDRQASGGKEGSAPKRQHLPYRDSKLTRILESALDGNAQIGIICTVSPTAKCVEETSNTLKFASRAKMIKMSAKVNETMDDKTLLRVYKEEIEQLRSRLQELEQQHHAKASVAAKGPTMERSESMSSIISATASADGQGRNTASEAEEEDANLMLQMIAEMERLILRADTSRPVGYSRPGVAMGTPWVAMAGATSSGGRRSIERRRSSSIGSTGEGRSVRPDRRRGSMDSTSSTNSNGGGGEVIEGGTTGESHSNSDAALLSSHGLRPKHLPPPSGSPRGLRKKKAYPNSNSALLSLIVEATDSDNLVRIDTIEDSDLDSGTEPEGSSDTESLQGDADHSVGQGHGEGDEQLKGERAASRGAVLDDIITAEQDQEQNEVSLGSSTRSTGVVGAGVPRLELASAEEGPGKAAVEGDVSGAAAMPAITEEANPTTPPTVSPSADRPTRAGIPPELRSSPSGVVHSPKRSTTIATNEGFEREGLTPMPASGAGPGAGPVLANGERSPSWFIPTTSPIPSPRGNTPRTVSPPARTLPKSGSGSRTLGKTPQPQLTLQPSQAGTSIPRLSSARSRGSFSNASNRTEPSLRSMSIDSAAGGDEYSALSSYRGDSSWDEYDAAGEVTRKSHRPAGKLPTPSAPQRGISRTAGLKSGGSTTRVTIATPPTQPAAVPVEVARSGSSTKLTDLMEEPVGFPPPMARVASQGAELARSASQSWPKQLMDSVEDDSVLLGVSKMLMILKGHVSSKARTRYGEAIRTDTAGASSAAGTPGSAATSVVATPSAASAASPLVTAQTDSPKGSFLLQQQQPPVADPNTPIGLRLHEKFDYERLKLDFKLKEADNRFLQEELENKDRMLAMLTEGLKEVEQSQTLWLTANQDLSYELEKALYQNKMLKTEVEQLQAQLAALQGRGQGGGSGGGDNSGGVTTQESET